MKKIIILLFCTMYSCPSNFFASTFTVGVPQEFVDQNSALMVYIVDSIGNLQIGRYQLDSKKKCRTIFQNELEMTTWQEPEFLDSAVNLLDSQESLGQDVVILHFEFDHTVKILKILVVKSSFLEDNPFDVLTFPVEEQKKLHAFEEFDEEDDALDALVNNMDVGAMEKSIQEHDQQTSRLDQYMLYAEIYMLMQYGRVKRVVHNVTSWFYDSL